MRTFDENQAAVFRQLANGRKERTAEIALLQKLVREKLTEIQIYDGRLSEDFGIDPDLSYSYNPTNRTVYLMQVPSDEADPDPTATENRLHASNAVPHKVLAAGKESQIFIRLLAAKRLTRQQVNLLNMLLREKRLEMKKVQDALSERFGIDPGRNYRFEADSRTLYLTDSPKESDFDS